MLTQSVFGVEIEEEACLITEFSLILTLLNYISPPALHQNEAFKFPILSEKNIYHADFFDDESHFWQENSDFTGIIGSPPWKKLKPKELANRKAWNGFLKIRRNFL
ncbi:MAG: hypothetical protein R2865_16415 [Deinococcales bacterium]